MKDTTPSLCTLLHAHPNPTTAVDVNQEPRASSTQRVHARGDLSLLYSEKTVWYTHLDTSCYPSAACPKISIQPSCKVARARKKRRTPNDLRRAAAAGARAARAGGARPARTDGAHMGSHISPRHMHLYTRRIQVMASAACCRTSASEGRTTASGITCVSHTSRKALPRVSHLESAHPIKKRSTAARRSAAGKSS